MKKYWMSHGMEDGIQDKTKLTNEEKVKIKATSHIQTSGYHLAFKARLYRFKAHIYYRAQLKRKPQDISALSVERC